MNEFKRGELYYADLSPVVGSEQGGVRPVLIIQNDIGNKYSPTVIAAAITSKLDKTKLPTHIDIYADGVGLAKDSVVLLEQVRTVTDVLDREAVPDTVREAVLRLARLAEGIRPSASGEPGSSLQEND